jgi:hypothetical protein
LVKPIARSLNDLNHFAVWKVEVVNRNIGREEVRRWKFQSKRKSSLAEVCVRRKRGINSPFFLNFSICRLLRTAKKDQAVSQTLSIFRNTAVQSSAASSSPVSSPFSFQYGTRCSASKYYPYNKRIQLKKYLRIACISVLYDIA